MERSIKLFKPFLITKKPLHFEIASLYGAKESDIPLKCPVLKCSH